MSDLKSRRKAMVSDHIYARGVRDVLVLEAMGRVPREKFLPASLREHAYEDRPLPIAGGQTISQPYIVAYMVEALNLRGGEKVLEIGAGSGYAAAVMAEIAAEVYTIDRIGELAEKAASSLADAGYHNVHVRHADGTQGWAAHAPFDAILVSAGAPDVPKSLKEQLKVGGRLVIPVGRDSFVQELIRITRVSEADYDREDLADVRFVPLIGEEGWEDFESWERGRPRTIVARPRGPEGLPGLISRHGDTFADIDDADLVPLIERIGDARVVLIGEASHGTSEFYRMRARITQRLIVEKSFDIVAAEADWPDAAKIDHYVRHREVPASEWTAFARFPTWMWRNRETREFVDWLHHYNFDVPYEKRTGFYGLDLYSLYASVREVIDYLDGVSPDLARIARDRYGCLSPWEADPAAYGHAALTSAYHSCEGEVVGMLGDLLVKRNELTRFDGERFLDAERNASVVANAEAYYRTMYYGSRSSWNLRDSHMFDTLKGLLDFRGPRSKAVVWAHNSHIGNAAATEMSARGEHNIGQLSAEHWGNAAYRIGFGTDHGFVAAASHWDGPMEVKAVRPAHRQSYERQFHLTNVPGLILPLREPHAELVADLARPRLERAIGVIYRPETELASHYFEAVLPRQFDDYVWIDETSAVTPLSTAEIEGLPDTYPFGM